MCPADLADCADFLLLRICEPFGVGSRDPADDVGTTSKDLADKQLVAAAIRILCLFELFECLTQTETDLKGLHASHSLTGNGLGTEGYRLRYSGHSDCWAFSVCGVNHRRCLQMKYFEEFELLAC